jgi:DNA-binding NarL/FixJ family response regulator
VREGLRGLLADDFELVGQAANGRELVDECRRLKPDVAVADISMPLLNGIDAARQIREEGIPTRIVFLTMHPDMTYATRALDTGASGYVLKHAAPEELVAAIHEALRGGVYLSLAMRTPAMEELLVARKSGASPGLELTPRQREVLQLLAEGRSAKEIGAILNISPRTAETHKYKLMDDLGVKTSAELVQYAIRHGLVSL